MRYIYQVAYSYYDDYSDDFAYTTKEAADRRCQYLKDGAVEEHEEWLTNLPEEQKEWHKNLGPDDHYHVYRILMLEQPGEEQFAQECGGCHRERVKTELKWFRNKRFEHDLPFCEDCVTDLPNDWWGEIDEPS